jgi:hypothetical protein
MEMAMRNLRVLVVAGVAAIGIAGYAGFAAAESPGTHVMSVALPGGGVAEIRYTGDVPPQVTVAPDAPSFAAFAPLPAMFGPDSVFAQIERISAAMDRHAATLLRQAEALAAQPPSGPTEAALADLPAGSGSYSFVSTMTGNGVCMRSVEITSRGDGQPPRIVRHASGDCGSMPNGADSVVLPPAPAPRPTPDILETKAHGAQPYAGLVREATWQR